MHPSLSSRLNFLQIAAWSSFWLLNSSLDKKKLLQFIDLRSWLDMYQSSRIFLYQLAFLQKVLYPHRTSIKNCKSYYWSKIHQFQRWSFEFWSIILCIFLLSNFRDICHWKVECILRIFQGKIYKSIFVLNPILSKHRLSFHLM